MIFNKLIIYDSTLEVNTIFQLTHKSKVKRETSWYELGDNIQAVQPHLNANSLLLFVSAVEWDLNQQHIYICNCIKIIHIKVAFLYAAHNSSRFSSRRSVGVDFSLSWACFSRHHKSSHITSLLSIMQGIRSCIF